MKKRKIFYKIYFAYIIVFVAAMSVLLFKLYHWLKDYEASQPTMKCEEVFAELFEAGDWGKVYELSGTEDTRFEDKDAYIAYMKEKVGDRELVLSETSAGLSGDKKYFVKLGDEKLLSYTLVSSEDMERGIDVWNLGEVEPFFTRRQSVRIEKDADQIAYVNGVELTEEYTVQKTETLAENYLPEGVHGVRRELQVVDGLLVQPEVKVCDAEGNPLEVAFDENTNTYRVQAEDYVISDEEREAVLTVAKEYSKRMLGISVELFRYFDRNSEIYNVIRRNENWMQDFTGYDFAEEEVSNYYSYTEDLYSARVSLTLNVTRRNGTIKEYKVDSTLFMERKEDGKWLAVDMANIDVQQSVTEVRLTFCQEEAALSTEFVRSDSQSLTTPAVNVPENKIFAGWMKEETDAEGRRVQTLMFVPDEAGLVTLPEDYELEPMTLYPLFETTGN